MERWERSIWHAILAPKLFILLEKWVYLLSQKPQHTIAGASDEKVIYIGF